MAIRQMRALYLNESPKQSKRQSKKQVGGWGGAPLFSMS
jgi:hypothetical protein